MADGLGRVYADGEVIVRQGEAGTCMYAIQSGQVEVAQQSETGEIVLGVLEEGDVFGDMAILEHTIRSATVRAKGEARVLTIDRRTFLQRVQADPSIALNIMRSMARRVRRLDRQVVALRTRLAAAGATDPSQGGAEREETG